MIFFSRKQKVKRELTNETDSWFLYTPPRIVYNFASFRISIHFNSHVGNLAMGFLLGRRCWPSWKCSWRQRRGVLMPNWWQPLPAIDTNIWGIQIFVSDDIQIFFCTILVLFGKLIQLGRGFIFNWPLRATDTNIW